MNILLLLFITFKEGGIVIEGLICYYRTTVFVPLINVWMSDTSGKKCSRLEWKTGITDGQHYLLVSILHGIKIIGNHSLTYLQDIPLIRTFIKLKLIHTLIIYCSISKNFSLKCWRSATEITNFSRFIWSLTNCYRNNQTASAIYSWKCPFGW